MKYVLDTNACIAILNGPPTEVVARLHRTSAWDIVLCSVVKSELLYGAHKSAKRVENLEKLETFFGAFRSLPFDDAAAALAGEVRATLDRQGTPIGANDLLIGAIALANNLTLVTHNTGEFGRVPGLAMDDWEVGA